jgi:hypothetical protein
VFAVASRITCWALTLLYLCCCISARLGGHKLRCWWPVQECICLRGGVCLWHHISQLLQVHISLQAATATAAAQAARAVQLQEMYTEVVNRTHAARLGRAIMCGYKVAQLTTATANIIGAIFQHSNSCFKHKLLCCFAATCKLLLQQLPGSPLRQCSQNWLLTCTSMWRRPSTGSGVEMVLGLPGARRLHYSSTQHT